GHTPTQEQGEHALEVQLPFLQRVLGDFKLVPIVMGDQNYETERALGVALAKMLKCANTGDVTGDHSRVVGYSAVALFQAQSHAAGVEPFSLGSKEKEA